MVSLEEWKEVREADLRLSTAHVALCDVLLEHSRTLAADGLRLDVTLWKGKLALELSLVDAPRALPSPDPEGGTAKRDWSLEDDTRILSLEREGLAVKKIAPLVNRSWQAVAFRLKKLHAANPAGGFRLRLDPAPEAKPDPVPEAEPEPAPEAEPEPAPEAEPEPAPLSAAFHLDLYGLTAVRAREAERRLREVGYPDPFTPAGDLAMVVALGRGDGMGAAAAAAGVTVDLAKARWKSLLPEVTIENQTALLTVLRARADLASA